jgi:hypothetical protein
VGGEADRETRRNDDVKEERLVSKRENCGAYRVPERGEIDRMDRMNRMFGGRNRTPPGRLFLFVSVE